MGSGSCGVASSILNRNFIGIEKDENYFNVAKQRIEDCKKNIFDLITIYLYNCSRKGRNLCQKD